MTTVVAGQVCRPGLPERGWVAWSGGQIEEVRVGAPPRGALDLGDALVMPGCIDLQVNGVDTLDLASSTPTTVDDALDRLCERGTTSALVAVVTRTLEEYPAVLDRLVACARPIGVHLEGPFVGNAPGAHPAEHIRTVEVTDLVPLVDRHPDLVRMVTLAPEADPLGSGTVELVRRGVLVALGHSTCSYDEAVVAADRGARAVTHVFNAMAPLHHRNPGLAGAALDDSRLVPTLIADGVHVAPAVVRVVFAAAESVALVSDAVASETGDTVPTRPDGTIMGATVDLATGVANCIAWGVRPACAVAAATSVPADLVGVEDRGRLEPGRRADVLVLPTDGPRAVWRDGDRVV